MENENQNEGSSKIVAAVLAAAAVGGVIVMRDKIRGFFSRNKTVWGHRRIEPLKQGLFSFFLKGKNELRF